MIPPKGKVIVYEKVKTGEMISGQIADIKYNDHYKYKDHETGEYKEKDVMRFIFKLDGYQYPHRSRWLTFSLHEKSNLYKDFVSKLVENAEPGMSFDLDELKLMPIKMIWSDNGDYQNIDAIYPAGKKITVNVIKDLDEVQTREELPF